MAPSSLSDPFDSLLTLEDDLYTTAYAIGTKDGAKAGRVEGRIFGLEKGFEKFSGLGQLHGRAVVWGARLSPGDGASDATLNGEKDGHEISLPPLKDNGRLKKHIQMLHGLSDPATFSTRNTEEAVADFDDRFKRAGAKAKVIERLVGEASSLGHSQNSTDPSTRTVRVSGKNQKKGDNNMEDFGGSPFLS